LEILSKKYTFKKVISGTIVVLFFALIFFWYSQVTEAAFNSGVNFVEQTFNSFFDFAVIEAKSKPAQTLLGEGIMQADIVTKIHWVLTWITFAFIGIGVATLIRRYKEMSFPELKFKKQDFLKDKFEIGYFTVALACSGFLVVMITLPYTSKGYGMDRLYGIAIIILSVFFVIGGIMIAKTLSFIKKALLKKQKEGRKENKSQVGAYLIILLVLIPYFLCVSGVMYNLFDVPQKMILNSEGEEYDLMYIHDDESYGAKWLKINTDEKAKIYGDYGGTARLVSQGMIRSPIYPWSLFGSNKPIRGGYIYLRYCGVVDGKLLDRGGKRHNITEYSDTFEGRHRIYDNRGSEVWK